MRTTRSRAVAVALLLLSLLLGGLVHAPGAQADSAHVCRATFLQASLGGTSILPPLAEANGAENGCPTIDKSLIALGPLTIPGTDLVLTSKTINASTGSGTASSSAEQLTIAPLLSAELISSTATARCGYTGQPPSLSGSSTIARVVIGDTELIDVDQPVTIALPGGLGAVHLNRTVTDTSDGNYSVTQQAIVVEIDGLEIVVAESYSACDVSSDASLLLIS